MEGGGWEEGGVGRGGGWERGGMDVVAFLESQMTIFHLFPIHV